MGRVLAISEWHAVNGVTAAMQEGLAARTASCKALDVRYWVFAHGGERVVEFVEGANDDAVQRAVTQLPALAARGDAPFRYFHEVEL